LRREKIRKDLCWSLSGNLRHNSIWLPERDPNCKYGKYVIERTHVDTGAWVTFDHAVEYYEGDGFTKVRFNKTRAAERPGKADSFDLPAKASRAWCIDHNDTLQVVVKSNKDRYRRMVRANTLAGVEIPCWLAAKHGHSIASVNPMRAGLRVIKSVEFNTLPLLGKVTHKTSVSAARGIMQSGLRNDFDGGGKLGGRIGIVADPFGRGDLAKNTYLQRADGPARVIIEMYIWRAMCGAHAADECGVRLYATGAGALLFSSAKAQFATVLPTSAFEKVMMRHAVDDRFAQSMRDSGVRDSADPMCGSVCQSAACQMNWFNIWSSKLAIMGLPPPDTVRLNDDGEPKDIHYQYLPTMDERDTPEMGLGPGGYTQEWMFDSEAVSIAGLEDVVRRREREILPMMENAKTHVAGHVRTFNNYGVRNAVFEDLAIWKFLRIKGKFVACPYCLHRATWLTPIRQGQLVRTNDHCWEVTLWRTMDEEISEEATAIAKAREVIRDAHTERVTGVHERSSETRTTRACEKPQIRRMEKWDSGFLAEDGSGLTNAMAWAAAGGTREHPKPHVVCPWEPCSANPQPPYEWDVFPDGFEEKLKKFMFEDVIHPFCRVHSATFYNRMWACVHDSIISDLGVYKRWRVKQYLTNVVRRTRWRAGVGQHRRGWYASDCFQLANRLTRQPSRVHPTLVARRPTTVVTPPAVIVPETPTEPSPPKRSTMIHDAMSKAGAKTQAETLAFRVAFLDSSKFFEAMDTVTETTRATSGVQHSAASSSSRPAAVDIRTTHTQRELRGKAKASRAPEWRAKSSGTSNNNWSSGCRRAKARQSVNKTRRIECLPYMHLCRKLLVTKVVVKTLRVLSHGLPVATTTPPTTTSSTTAIRPTTTTTTSPTTFPHAITTPLATTTSTHDHESIDNNYNHNFADNLTTCNYDSTCNYDFTTRDHKPTDDNYNYKSIDDNVFYNDDPSDNSNYHYNLTDNITTNNYDSAYKCDPAGNYSTYNDSTYNVTYYNDDHNGNDVGSGVQDSADAFRSTVDDPIHDNSMCSVDYNLNEDNDTYKDRNGNNVGSGVQDSAAAFSSTYDDSNHISNNPHGHGSGVQHSADAKCPMLNNPTCSCNPTGQCSGVQDSAFISIPVSYSTCDLDCSDCDSGSGVFCEGYPL
jgi:hypothetical protein